MKTTIQTSLALLAALSLAACGSTGGGADASGIGGGIIIRATSSASAPAAATTNAITVQSDGDEADDDDGDGEVDYEGHGSDGTVFYVNSASVSIRTIDIELPEGTTCADLGAVTLPENVTCKESEEDDDDGPRVRVTGPYVVDLMTGTSTPSLADLLLPPLVYNKIKIKFDSVDEDDEEELVDTEDPILGNTLVAAGSFNYDSTDYTFDLALDFDEEVEFENVDGAAIDAATLNNLIVELDVNAWFASVGVGECIIDGDLVADETGHVTINDSTDECDILDSIKDAVEASGEFGDDHDDGEDD
ncbi:MAG: hypothetical protein KIT79_01120 [Deltaproteobacteria bacterium]|nr:hypothetical protein [Deltaproteobacteria bacterium]